MPSSFAQNLIAGMQAGQQRKQQEQEFANAQEDRGIRKMLLDLELRKTKIEEAVHRRELVKGNFDLQNGQPNADIAQPIQEGQTGAPLMPQMPGGPSMPLSEAAPAGFGAPPMTMTAPTTAPMQGTIAPVNIPGVDELGVPGVSVKPRSMEDLIGAQTAAKYRDIMMTPQKAGPGETITLPGTGQVLAQGGEKPKDAWETFKDAYPATIGQPGVSFDALSPQQKIGSLQKFKEVNQDPDMRAASLALRAAAAAARNPDSTINQQKLEQQYRTVLQRTLSSRSGGLGLEDQKVNQAVHLLSLFDQNRDAKTGAYTIPKMMVPEVTLGLARLISPTGQPAESVVKDLNQRTAKGDIAGIVTYLTGEPVTGSTQDIFQSLRDSIERQGGVAESNRQVYLDAIKNMAPTDLDEGRRQQIEKSLVLNSLANQSKTAPVGQTMKVGGFTVTVH